MEALYFTATWCQPCKVFGPIMEKIGKDFVVQKIDIQKEPETTDEFSVLSVPTVIFVNDNDLELGRFVGARTEDWVRGFINNLG